jgi:uncharacterized protein (DUF2062 family)
VTRSLFPWPHRRLFQGKTDSGRLPGIFQPVRFFKALTREHSTAVQLATAVWIGIFIGSLPIIPFGIATIIYACHRLHLNKLAAAGASNICVAPFVPFFCIELGHYLLYGTFWYEFNRQTLLMEIHLRLREWLIGALLLGPLLGTVGALLTYFLVNIFRKGMRSGVLPEQDALTKKVEVP